MTLLKRLIIFVLCTVALGVISAQRKTRSLHLASSKFLTAPAPGDPQRTNSYPVTIALSPDGRYAALLNDGYGTQNSLVRQSISILDLQNNDLSDFPDDRFAENAHQSLFAGLVFSSDGGHLYASVGSISDPTGRNSGNLGNGVAVYSFAAGKVRPEKFLPIPLQTVALGKKIASGLRKSSGEKSIAYPAGLTLVHGEPGDRLLVANNLSDNAVLLDVGSGRILRSIDLSTNRLIPSSYPISIVASQDGRRAWCSLWNASRVVELDLTAGTVKRSIPLLPPVEATAPGSHPDALVLSPDEKRLYVALANADAVAVIDTSSGTALRFFDARLPSQKYFGSFPSGLALSEDGKRLFVAEAALDAVAVFDTADSKPSEVRTPALGFLPTEWYTSAVAVRGNHLLIATAKGQGSGPNHGISEVKSERRKKAHPYIATLIGGSIARLPLDQVESRLTEFTRQVEEDNLFRSEPEKMEFASGKNPIKHIIYVLKENRTYDQVLGDLPVGNGDPSLTMYGAEVTPNAHKLALQFGVLDNFHDSGEVSGDGHVWSTAAITTDYNERTWPIAYRGVERTYDFQGTLSDEFPIDNDESDVNDPASGYLWDNLSKSGLSYRIYGEFVTATWCRPERAISPKEGTPSPFTSACIPSQVRKGEALPAHVGQPHGSPSPYPWALPILKSVRPTKAALREHIDPLYPDFNTDYPDQLRADQFLNEFQSFVRARQERMGTELPNFILLYLPNDHTGGTRAGKPTPNASIADNDLALGRVVEAVSHSPYWEDTAIFILEDDAQDGADHVDAHRSTAFIVSKYSPGSSQKTHVDSQFHTTVSMIHTMEVLLGLPPMNQNDAWSPLISSFFTGAGDQAPYIADTSNRDNGLIYTINAKKAVGAQESLKLDFSRPDSANTAQLNAILWQTAKGNAPPATHAGGSR